MYEEEFFIKVKKWDMDKTESKVFKLCLLWEEIVSKEFGNNWITRLRKSGDPRKSTLFKYCWKLYRETKGLIPDNEYKLYIKAQLQIFKNLQNKLDKNKEGPRIDATVLVGPKAWKRWMYWRNLYNKQIKVEEHSEQIQTNASDGYAYRISEELVHTKAFLEKQAEGPITKNFIKQICSDRTLLRWVTFGKVSPYYVLLSKYVNEFYGTSSFEKANNIKLGIYVKSINKLIKNHFENCFDEST